MTKSSEARRERYRKRADGKTVKTVYSPYPEELKEYTDWILTSPDPEAVAIRAELMKRNMPTDFVPADVLEIRHIDNKLQ